MKKRKIVGQESSGLPAYFNEAMEKLSKAIGENEQVRKPFVELATLMWAPGAPKAPRISESDRTLYKRTAKELARLINKLREEIDGLDALEIPHSVGATFEQVQLKTDLLLAYVEESKE